MRATLDLLVAWLPLLLPLATLGFLLVRLRRASAGSVVPRWDIPEGIPPGPAGVLVDRKADLRDVIASILDLAVRGTVEIREVPASGTRIGRALEALGVEASDWEIALRTPERKGLRIYERLILDAVFRDAARRRFSQLTGALDIHMGEIRRALYSELVGRKLFAHSPGETRRRWLLAGLGIVAGGIVIVAIGSTSTGIGVLASGAILALFSPWMPVESAQGARVRRELLGFREYVLRAEKAELEFHDAPEATPERFRAILPFAAALGISDLWVRRFAGVLTGPGADLGGSLASVALSELGRAAVGLESAATRALGRLRRPSKPRI